VAVRSDGCRLLERPVWPFEDAEGVEDELWDLLDDVDPVGSDPI
jgi:hypothetical protein